MNPADYPRCKTCKWWGVDSLDDDDGYCPCLNALVNIESHSGQLSPSNGLNGSDFEYRTNTGPDFGCVHWEAKDA